MTWWCSAAGQQPWTWAWRGYLGVWLVVAVMAGSYVITARRRRADGRWQPGDRRRAWWFGLGTLLLWVSTDWPIGPLGAGYLASVHMAQFQLYTLVVAPLLLLGLPADVARAMVARLGISSALPYLARPVVAGVVFNAVLLATHAPFTVDALRTSQLGSFALDVAWLLSGFILWLPIVSPLPELVHPSPAVRCVYLFLAGGALAMIPGALITFAPYPLYRIYELAPRVGDFSALDDQQVAGIVMKIGNLPVIWIVLCTTFVRWARRDATIPYITLPEQSDEEQDQPVLALPNGSDPWETDLITAGTSRPRPTTQTTSSGASAPRPRAVVASAAQRTDGL